MRETARQKGVCTQMGNQGTADSGFRRAVELVRSGAHRRGARKFTSGPTARSITGSRRRTSSRAPKETPPIPSHVHWDLFLGSAPERPYNPVYHPHNWRGWWDFGTGSLGDMACHTTNLLFMALELGLPVRVSAKSGEINPETYPAWATITYEFPARGNLPPVKLTWYEGRKDGKRNLPPSSIFPDRALAPSDSGSRDGRFAVADVFAERLWGNPGGLAQGRLHRAQGPRALLAAHAGTRRDTDTNQKREWVDAIRAGKPSIALSNFDYCVDPHRVDAAGQRGRPLGPGHRLQSRYRRNRRQLLGQPVSEALFPQGMGNLSDVRWSRRPISRRGARPADPEGFAGFFAVRRDPEHARASGQEQSTRARADEELTWRTAKRMYFSDAAAQRLLDRVDRTIMLADDFPETIERIADDPRRARTEVSFHRRHRGLLLRRSAVHSRSGSS